MEFNDGELRKGLSVPTMVRAVDGWGIYPVPDLLLSNNKLQEHMHDKWGYIRILDFRYFARVIPLRVDQHLFT
jgi:hypothetical protein